MRLPTLLAPLLLLAGFDSEAHADDVQEEKQFYAAASLGFSHLGQLGAELAFRPLPWLGVAGGAGLELLNGSPYHKEGRPRLALSTRLRQRLNKTTAIGLEVGGWYGNLAIGRFSEDKATLTGALALFGNAFVERSYSSGFFYRVFAGGRTLIHEGQCDAMGTSICENPLDAEHKSGGFRQFGVALGARL